MPYSFLRTFVPEGVAQAALSVTVSYVTSHFEHLSIPKWACPKRLHACSDASLRQSSADMPHSLAEQSIMREKAQLSVPDVAVVAASLGTF